MFNFIIKYYKKKFNFVNTLLKRFNIIKSNNNKNNIIKSNNNKNNINDFFFILRNKFRN